MRAVLAGFALALLAAVGVANAHTVSIGFANAGPGSVSFWYGSYHSYDLANLTEGSFNLVGINGNTFPSTTVVFSLNAGTKPAGLVDGTTNFYADNANGLTPTCTLGAGNCPTTGTPGSDSWQGVTFSGLQVGQYRFTYIPIASPSAHWNPWNTAVQSSTVTITQGVLGVAMVIPTLDPAILALMALVVAGLGVLVLRRMS